MLESKGQKPGWSPLVNILVFSVACVLVGLVGASIGFAIAWAWLSVGHELPNDFSQIHPRQKFVFSAAAISVSYPTLALLTIAFMHRSAQMSFVDFGLTKQGWWRDLSCGVLLGGAIVALMFSVYSLTGLVRFEPVDEVSWKQWLLMSLWLCPLIGLTEELVFRGYLLSVAEKWKGRVFAVVFTSVLFWLAHWGQGNVHELLGAAGTLTLATTFAIARYLTGKIWFPVGLHAGYDWVALSFGGDVGLGFPTMTEFHSNVPAWLVGPPGRVGVLDLGFYLILLAVTTVFAKRLAKNG